MKNTPLIALTVTLTAAAGVYQNFTGLESLDRIRASYRGNDERLVAAKSKWDPQVRGHVESGILIQY